MNDSLPLASSRRIALRRLKWRIYDLGFSHEIFGSIDRDILKERSDYGRSANGREIDRYGKKYSWIAFFEMAGYLQDQGLLEIRERCHRVTDCDIDPSFPELPRECTVIEEDFLEDRDITLEDWLTEVAAPDIQRYFILHELCGHHGPWVLLYGFVRQRFLGYPI